MPEFKPQSVPDPLPQPGGSVNFDLPPDPEFGPPNRFKQFYGNNKWYIWAIVLGAVIIGVLAYFAFHKQTAEPTKDANVLVTVMAPDTAPSGGEVIYKIQIDNRDKSKLVDMKLELVYDDGLNYVSSVPPSEGSGGNTFPVPDLGSGENAVLMIKTTVSGDINEEKRLVARLHYRFDNFNSEFTAEEVHTTRLVAADIVLDVTGPQKTTNVQNAVYDIYYRNDSEKSINGARIQVTYPEEFKFENSTPTPSLGRNIWNLNDLDKNESGKISISGAFPNAKSGQSVIFKIEFLALDDHSSYFTQASTTYMTNVISQPLSAEIKAIGQSAGGIADPGSSIEYEVKYQNNTEVVATGLNVVVDVNSKAIDSGSIKPGSGLVQGNTITWNASADNHLEKLNPGESGTIRFSLSVKNPAVTDNSENIDVIAKTRIKSNENGNFFDGNEVSVKISSPSAITKSLSAAGQIPPQVGKQTTMQVTLSLKNSSNDYQQGTLVAFIPQGVSFDKASVSPSESAVVKYDQSTGKLTWSVNQLAAHSGASAQLRTLQFKLNVTPTANQVGQSISLLKNIGFTAKDAYTGQNISITSQELTSEYLPGENSGRVVQ